MNLVRSRRNFLIQASSAALGAVAGRAAADEKDGGLRGLIKPPELKAAVPIDEIELELNEVIPGLMAENNVPGMGMAIIRNGRVAWSGSFGVKSAKSGEPVDKETIFGAASLTKPVFATAVMKLVEAGEIDLDRPLAKYVDRAYIDEADQRERLESVTARHVLSHRTGLPNWRRGPQLKFLTDPGTRWGYSGEGYVYLQRAVESLTRKPMEELLREQIFGPLELKLSELKWTDAYKTLAADAHNAKGESMGKRELSVSNAAGSLYTTPGEYARFMTLFLEPLRSEQSILKTETMQMMLTPQSEIRERAALGRVAWGLGWGLQQSADGQAFWHWGSDPGFKAFCIGYPEQRVGAAVFTNADFGWKVHRNAIPLAIGGDSTALMWKS
jgi:CubicO group peptidase (beta-lactamase class C family)